MHTITTVKEKRKVRTTNPLVCSLVYVISQLGKALYWLALLLVDRYFIKVTNEAEAIEYSCGLISVSSTFCPQINLDF